MIHEVEWKRSRWQDLIHPKAWKCFADTHKSNPWAGPWYWRSVKIH